ncbi:DUF2971 domain-containing protein [Sneathiella litorea]|uniref:DUF2971 domain-containing protein n=1 Tax=Sneathiella litorea TaxID=2606216 RepID=A0A6L8W8N5_9PROT|nr:DUF2971 domain-containing protein [Sneathiella litorea]MZR31029.1 DUF2971 domain-containing protein [Sneathiella litorea]
MNQYSQEKTKSKLRRIYKFCGLAKHALDSLERKRIKICTGSDINDPFDVLPYLDLHGTSHEYLIQLRDTVFSRFGFISFSRNWENPLLWSHYCDNHRGICLGFDIWDDDKIVDIDYVKSRPDELRWKGISIKEGRTRFSVMAADIFRYKMAEWRYENECRTIEELPSRDIVSGLYFRNFKDSQLKLKEVIIGAHCEVPFEDIKSILPTNSDVKIIKAGLNLRQFQVANKDKLEPH